MFSIFGKVVAPIVFVGVVVFTVVSLAFGGSTGGVTTGVLGGPAVLEGQLIGMQPGTALWIMDAAAQAKAGFYVFENSAFPTANLWVGRVGNGGIGFVLTGAASDIVTQVKNCGGQVGLCKTVVDFVKWAQSSGWKTISPEQIRPEVLAALHASIQARLISGLAISSGDMFVMVPAEALTELTPMQILEQYTGYTPPEWQ